MLTFIRRKFNALFHRRSSDGAFIAREATGMFSVRLMYKLLGFGIIVLLARLVGSEGYGAYAFSMSWAAVLSIPAVFGMDRMMMREMSVYIAQKDWGLIRGVLQWSFQRVALFSAAVMAAAAVFGYLALAGKPDLQKVFWVGLLMIPCMGFVRLLQGGADAFKSISLGRVPDQVIQPSLYALSVVLVYWLARHALTASTAMALYVVTTLVFSIGIGSAILLRRIPPEVVQSRPIFNRENWMRIAAAFVIISGVVAVNNRLSTILLGFLSTTENVGIYNAMTRGTEVISFILVAVNGPLARVATNLFVNREIPQLQRLVTRAVRLAFILSFPLAIGFIILGKWYLMIFGPEFTIGATALVILVLGEVVNSAAGPNMVLLGATGFERDAAWAITTALAVNVVLGFILIPRYGLNGAALAEASSMVLWNILMTGMAYRRIGVNTTIFAARS